MSCTVDARVDLSVDIAGVKLKNPVMVASGTFGFGTEYAAYMDVSRLGAIVTKGLTLQPRTGNPPPRIWETPAGMLNSIGLQNPGIDAYLEHHLPALRAFKVPVIANVCGDTVKEYAEIARRLECHEGADAIEVNISCPNVESRGQVFACAPDSAAAVIQAVRRHSDPRMPILAKLSPDVTDIVEIAGAVVRAGASGVSVINTLLGMRIDLKKRKPLLANKTGGLSGPAVFPVAVRMVYQVYEAVKIPIMGMGGVSSAKDVLEMMMAGASAVQIGAAGLKNPYIFKEIIQSLPETAEKYGIKRLKDIIGAGH